MKQYSTVPARTQGWGRKKAEGDRFDFFGFLYKREETWYHMHRKVWRLFEVVDFVPTTRRWYGQGGPERCGRRGRPPESLRISFRNKATSSKTGSARPPVFASVQLRNPPKTVKSPRQLFLANFSRIRYNIPASGGGGGCPPAVIRSSASVYGAAMDLPSECDNLCLTI